VTSNDGAKGSVAVALTTAPAGPIARVRVAPASLNFSASPSKPRTLTFRVTNVGAAGSVLTGSVAIAGAGFRLNLAPTNLRVARGHTQVVKVTFQPPAGVLSSTGNATVSTNDPNQTSVPVQLKGVKK